MAQDTQPSESLYFQMYGLSAQAPEALNDALCRAIESVHRALYAPSRDELVQSEVALLEQSGVEMEEHAMQADPMAAYVIEFGAILATC